MTKVGAMLAMLASAGALHGQEARLLVISGLGGSAEYSDQFHAQGAALFAAARDDWGLPADQVTWLAEDPARSPGDIDGRSTREALEQAIVDLAGGAGPDDRILVVFIGHGTAEGDASKLNLPGPDLAADDLAAWVATLPTQTVAVVNTASASGGFLEPLKDETRIVVTATRSARETERTHFGRFFVTAYTEDGADADRNGRVSLLEAFNFARDEVERFYGRENLLLTEHATIEDPGNRAAQFHMAGGAGAAEQPADPETARLLAEQTRLEEAIADLQARRATMDSADFVTAFEALAVELARTNRALRQQEGTP